jgi:hypothetical protein
LAGRSFSEEDVRRWAAEGLISEVQAEAILAAERKGEAASTARTEAPEGLNLPTVLYYLGASLVVIAIIVFATLNGQDVSRSGRIPIIAAGMLALLGSGHYVRTRTPYVRGGSALFALGVGMVPLFYLAIGDAIVVDDETIFSGDMLGEASLIQVLSLATMVAALAWSRAPLVSLAVAGQLIALTITAGILWLGTDDMTSLMLIVMGTAATLLLISLGYYYLQFGEHGFWFSLSGHGAFFYGFTYLAMDEWGIVTALTYLSTFIAFVVVSLVLRQRLYLIAGAAGVYVFVLRLIFDTFEESPFLPLALALVGVSMVVLAIVYQRYRSALPISFSALILRL